jgi:hypothetical protein
MFLPALGWLRYAPFAMGGALVALGGVALAVRSPSWLPWGTLLCGALFLLLGVAAVEAEPILRHLPHRRTPHPA